MTERVTYHVSGIWPDTMQVFEWDVRMTDVMADKLRSDLNERGFMDIYVQRPTAIVVEYDEFRRDSGLFDDEEDTEEAP